MFKKVALCGLVTAGIASAACFAVAGTATAATLPAASHDANSAGTGGRVGVPNKLDVYGTTVTQGSVQLKAAFNGSYQNEGTSAWQVVTAPADAIGQNSSNSYDLAGAFPKFDLNYEVLKADGSSSGYWLHTHFYDPMWPASNTAQCTFTTTDPSTGPAKVAAGAPYNCQWSNTGGSNPHPVLTVSDGTVVTDKQQATNLLNANCAKNTAHCAFNSVTLTSTPGTESTVGSIAKNPTPLDGNHGVTWSRTVGESNSLSVASATEMELGELVKETVTVTYQHTWEESNTFGETDSIDLPSGWMGWFTFAPNMQTATGSFTIGHPGDDNYTSTIIPSASFTTPTKAGVVTSHACKMQMQNGSYQSTCVPNTNETGTPFPYHND